ncbi:MAG: hypothetical protein QOG45_1683 [Chloroflexota bacterium]|nr:hypothetical protein [Chloroflexota bacterium]
MLEGGYDLERALRIGDRHPARPPGLTGSVTAGTDPGDLRLPIRIPPAPTGDATALAGIALAVEGIAGVRNQLAVEVEDVGRADDG